MLSKIALRITSSPALLLCSCGEGAKEPIHSNADRGNGAQPTMSLELDTGSPGSARVLDEMNLCPGTSMQLGWARAQESRAILRVVPQALRLTSTHSDADGVSRGEVELAAFYRAPGSSEVSVRFVGEASFARGTDRGANISAGMNSFQARLFSEGMDPRRRVDIYSEVEAPAMEFDLGSGESTTWLLCAAEGEACSWRVGLLDCDSPLAQKGSIIVDLGSAGNVTFEISRAYFYPSRVNYTRVTRASGSLDGRTFDEQDVSRLLFDTYDANFFAERFAVLFAEPVEEECGLAFEVAYDLAGHKAYVFDCGFQVLRELAVIDVMDSSQ